MPSWPWKKSENSTERMDLTSFLSDSDRIQTAEEASQLIFPPDAYLNGVVRHLARKLDMPIALVNFVYGDSTAPMAHIGLDMATHSYRPQDSICTYVAAAGSPMIFDSPQTAPMLSDCMTLGSYGEGGITYYAGSPVRFQDRVVGVVGVADTIERNHKNRKIMGMLRSHGKAIEDELMMRNAQLGPSRF